MFESESKIGTNTTHTKAISRLREHAATERDQRPPPPYTFEFLCLTVLSDYQTDRTVNDNSKQEGECEHCVLRLCRYQRCQNKSPASNGSAKQKNVSADSDIWKMPNIDQYIGLGDLSVDHYILADIISTKHIFETPF